MHTQARRNIFIDEDEGNSLLLFLSFVLVRKG